MLDWSNCKALEADPERQGGAWCFQGTRLPVYIIIEFMSRGYSIDDAIDQYRVDPEQLKEVLAFIAANLEQDKPDPVIEDFEAARRRGLSQHIDNSFIKTYKPVMDDASYRSFESMQAYRDWCVANLPEWLGYSRKES